MSEMVTAGGASPSPTRDIEALTPAQLGGEIRLLTTQARRMALSYGIQIGYRLKVAHEKVGPHGWAEWLARETEFSPAAASRFQKLYEGYGEAQGSLFGVENKFPTLEKISISNALRLLAVPEEEREEVAVELDAEHLSTRELEKALAERDAARKRAEEAMEERGFWEDKATEKALELDKVTAERDRILRDAQDDKKRIKELESKPVEVAVERDEEAIREAAAQARKTAEDAARAELDKLREKLNKAQEAQKKAEDERRRAVEDAGPYKEKMEAEAQKARAEAEELRAKLRAAESGAGEVAMLARMAQTNFAAAMDKIMLMQRNHPDVAEKMLTGMERIVEALSEQVRGARG